MSPKIRKQQKKSDGSGTLYKDRHNYYRISYTDKSFSPPQRKTAYLYDEEGRKVASRSIAEELAHDFMKNLRKEWTINSKEEALRRLVETKRLVTDIERDPDLIWKSFERKIYGVITTKTLKNYSWAWDTFSNFIMKNHKNDIKKWGMTEEIIIDFFLWCRKREYASKSYNHLRTMIRTILDRTLGNQTNEFFKNVIRLPKQQRARTGLTLEELQAMILICSDDSDFVMDNKDEWRCFLRFMAFTSMRGEDACHPEWDNIDLTNGTGTITFLAFKTRRYKPEPVTVPMHPELSHSVRLLNQNRDKKEKYVLPAVHARYHQYDGALGETVKKIMHAAGIVTQIDESEHIKYIKYKTIDKKTGKEVEKRRKICIKAMNAPRHSFATKAKDNNVPRSVVKEIMVHETEEMSDNYTHVNLDDMRAAIFKMPNLVPEETFNDYKFSTNQFSHQELKDILIREIATVDFSTLLEIKSVIDNTRKLDEIKGRINSQVPKISKARIENVLCHTNENIGKIFGISGSMVKRYFDKFNLPTKRDRIFLDLSANDIDDIREKLRKVTDNCDEDLE